MTVGFVGRSGELAALDRRLRRVGASGAGTAVALRGRRQVGKSRLVQEFCDRSGARYLFYAATKGAATADAMAAFTTELRESSLAPDPDLLPEHPPADWPDAFRTLAAALPDEPSIVVLDEVPWLAEQDPLFDGALQTAWDRLLAPRPVLLLLLGSDIHMMERLTAYDRPFFGRADNMVLGPLNPAETATALRLPPAEAIDAHLISGGLPGILRAWPLGLGPTEFLEQECDDPASALFSVPESALAAELPAPDQTRRVLEAVGSGDRTHATIAASAASRHGALPSGTLSPILRRLATEKRVLAVDEPLSTRPGRPSLYRVADSNLRLYLAALRSAQEQSRRGRPEAGFQLVSRRWSAWRGRAVEPLVRDSMALAGIRGRLPWPDVEEVGGWWNRRFDPELDLVGVDRAPVARRIRFVGSVKWLDSPFDRHDHASLLRAAPAVPGFSAGHTGLAVVSRSGLAGGLGADVADLVWGPADVLAAWQD